MRVAIIGSRSITMDAYPVLEQFMPKGTSEIVSGGAKGADALAEEYGLRECSIHKTNVRKKSK